MTLSFTPEAKEWLLEQNDEPEFGARPLRRILRRNLREPLADFLLRSDPPEGTQVLVQANGQKADGLSFAASKDGQPIEVEH